MFVNRYKKIAPQKLQLSPDISPPVRRHLMGSQPLLQNIEHLEQRAIVAAIAMAPPIAYLSESNNHYYCIGNFRSLVLAQHVPENVSITIALIEPPKKSHIDEICMKNSLLHDMAFGKETKSLPKAMLEAKKLVDARHPDLIASIAPTLKKKIHFLEAMGFNRRIQ